MRHPLSNSSVQTLDSSFLCSFPIGVMQSGQQFLTFTQLLRQSPQKVLRQHGNVSGFSNSPRQMMQSIYNTIITISNSFFKRQENIHIYNTQNSNYFVGPIQYFFKKNQLMTAIDAVIEELERLLEVAKEMESRCLSEILSLEKMVNCTHKCTPYVQPKELPKENIKKEIPALSVQEKVDAIMNEIETKQKIIEVQKAQNKPKIENKLPQIVVQKKPPIPTLNRNQKAVKNQIPAYVPPRNRNDVTGKVTQTTMRTSGQKVFRPEKTSVKKVDSKEQIKNRGNVRTSVQKIADKKETKPDVSTKKIETVIKKDVEVQPQKETKQQKPMTPIIQQKVVEKANQTKKTINKIKFATFHKEIEEILSQIFKQGPKNHKFQLQKLISECQTQQKGHKMHQDNNRRLFIKKLNNYAVSRHAVYPMSSYQLARNRWNYHPELNDFQLLLDTLQNQLVNLQLQKDCRIDKKSQYRITQSYLAYAQSIEGVRNDYEESKEYVPEMLDLSFTFNQQQVQRKSNEQTEWENLSQVNFNTKLLEMLEDITNRGTLEKGELRGLQVLSEVGGFRSKRSPVLLMRKDYQNWKKHYSDITS